MDEKTINELKQAIGYEKIRQVSGKKQADDRLHFALIGYQCKTLQTTFYLTLADYYLRGGSIAKGTPVFDKDREGEPNYVLLGYFEERDYCKVTGKPIVRITLAPEWQGSLTNTQYYLRGAYVRVSAAIDKSLTKD